MTRAAALGPARRVCCRRRQEGMLRIAAGRGWMATWIDLVTDPEDAIRPLADGRD